MAFFRFKQYSNTFPKNCKATSLKANVGPWKSSSTNSFSSTCFNGVVSSCLKVEYERRMISARSSAGMDEVGMKRLRMRKESSEKESDFQDSAQFEGRAGILSGM